MKDNCGCNKPECHSYQPPSPKVPHPANPHRAGSLIQLKSGSPPLTSCGTDDKGQLIFAWYVGLDLQVANLPSECFKEMEDG